MQVRVTERMIQDLRDKRIYFENNSDVYRLKVGDVLQFADDAEIEPYCGMLTSYSIPRIGSFSYSWSHLDSNMEIGRYCSISGGLTIPGPRHTPEYISTSSFMCDPGFSIIKTCLEDYDRKSYDNFVDAKQKPLPVIGHDVWIGTGVALMPGISIGNGAVIAANSVVTKSVLAYSIVGGNPAKFIKFRFNESIIERLQKLAWWKYNFADFYDLDLKDADKFIDQIGTRNLKEFIPTKISLRELLNNP